MEQGHLIFTINFAIQLCHLPKLVSSKLIHIHEIMFEMVNFMIPTCFPLPVWTDNWHAYITFIADTVIFEDTLSLSFLLKQWNGTSWIEKIKIIF